MIRLTCVVLSILLLGVAACGSPTAPRVAKKPSPATTPLAECVGGWDTQTGTPC